MKLYFLLFGFIFHALAFGTLNIVTTTEDLASVTKAIGGDKVSVTAIVKGTQDPHFIEAKPSFLVALSRADLLIAVGLSLEQGWLPLLQRGARQPKILPGASGFLDASDGVNPIEVAKDADRSEGDVHPFGNPHYMADPSRVLIVADHIKKKLVELDYENEKIYEAGLASFKQELTKRIQEWKKRLAPYKGIKIIGYHKTFNYLFDLLGFDLIGYLEPKPGIPPTAQHILSLIQKCKNEKVRLIVMEDYFDSKAAESLSEKTGLKTVAIPAYTKGHDKADTYIHWLDFLVQSLESGLKAGK